MHWLDRPLDTLASSLNRLLAIDSESRQRLERLNDRWIAIHLSAPTLSLHLTVEDATLQLAAGASDDATRVPDAVISGNALALLALARDPEAGGNAVRFSGDLGVIRDLRSLLAGTEIDWEEQLARMLGDLPAHRLGETGRAARRWLRQARSQYAGALTDYLTEEQALLPSRWQVEDFLDDVDRLRADADRLEARLRRLERRRRPE
ncbi:SCP2 sterol-binding domain-containing protein [Methylonatrum kenyense]|uniref:ubiquinone biosynthesis accessory factor UbiJ n=1 Tax=Methylonatrum kenyense TaxID=455253 RepID=UPI0020BE987B|nr:SCP2 sterol-binding domain-containing protein [Methylonatrum kenyense]MCK8515283.1 SCP2 sterol-binding domain-containing protein [Methylonatrum kenyense]